MLYRPLQSRYNQPAGDDFWAAGATLIVGTLACAFYVLTCVISLTVPSFSDQHLRASVQMGPVRIVSAAEVAALTPVVPPVDYVRVSDTGGGGQGCQKSYLSTLR
jgi:hypothetical protein